MVEQMRLACKLDTQALTQTLVAGEAGRSAQNFLQHEAESREAGASLTRSTWKRFWVIAGQVVCCVPPLKRESPFHGKPRRCKKNAMAHFKTRRSGDGPRPQ